LTNLDYWDKNLRKFFGPVYEGISSADLMAILSHVTFHVG